MTIREVTPEELRADLADARSLTHETQERIIEIILRELERRRIATYLE